MTMANGASYQHDTDLVVRARADAARRAGTLGRPDLADDVALVASELVTNAVLHAGGCSRVDVLEIPGGLRVEVRDHSHVPPVLMRQSVEALTGRGLRLVAAVAARWGAESDAGGKVVWAEITGGEVTTLFADLDEDDLLAAWDDTWEPGLDDTRFPIALGEVPTELLLDAKAHVDNIVRELSLASTGAHTGVSAELPEHLVSLIDAIERFAEARVAIKHQALEAARAGAATTHLSLDLPATAADDAETYLAALDEIDGYSRAKRLLTLDTPAQHRLFRRWYIGELVAQLRATSAGHSPPPVQSFQARLLAEVDRLAATQQLSDRAARLYTVAAALATAASPEAVATAVLTEGVDALGATGGGVLLAADANRLEVPGTIGYGDDLVARLRAESRDAELPAAVALRTGVPVWLESRDERDRRFPGLVGLEADTVAMCAVPLVVGQRRLGALRFSFTEARLFDDDERRFVLTLATQTAQALERAQLQHARVDVSRRLQRSLLPPALPEIPGADVAAIYHPFGDGLDVGGDFYDVWECGPDRWAFAIGDATGNGPEAAAMSAVVRHAMRALTMDAFDVEHVLATVNRVLLNAAVDDRFCTALFGVVTVDGHAMTVELANGGHPWPIVHRADGRVEHVPLEGTMLGVFDRIDVGTATVRLLPGETMVVVTDGVLEAHHEGGAFFDAEGVERVLLGSAGGADQVARDLERAVLDHTGGVLGDDLAAIVLHVLEH